MCHSLAIWSSAYSCLLCHLPLSYNQLAPLTSEHSCASSLHTWYILYIPGSQTLTASLFVTHYYARLSRTSPWTNPWCWPCLSLTNPSHLIYGKLLLSLGLRLSAASVDTVLTAAVQQSISSTLLQNESPLLLLCGSLWHGSSHSVAMLAGVSLPCRYPSVDFCLHDLVANSLTHWNCGKRCTDLQECLDCFCYIHPGVTSRSSPPFLQCFKRLC